MAEWENDLSPKPTVRTDGMLRMVLSAEDRRDLAGMYRERRLERYRGELNLSVLNTRVEILY